jgi:hypothetical protein
VVGFCEHGNEPSSYIKKAGYCLTSRMTISFSKNILHHGVNKKWGSFSQIYFLKQGISLKFSIDAMFTVAKNVIKLFHTEFLG